MPVSTRMPATSRRRNYKHYIKKPEYETRRDKLNIFFKKAHEKRNISAQEYTEFMGDMMDNPVVSEMKKYNHHSHTSCYQHSVHVSYYNYLICKKFGWDTKAAAKGGLLHDLFLYDWHGHKTEMGERMHGFEHPTKALKNAQSNFDITEKEGDIIKKHMFPLTVTPPKYKESYVIAMTDKFCSFGEVMDRFFKGKKRATFRKDTRKQIEGSQDYNVLRDSEKTPEEEEFMDWRKIRG